MDSNRKEMFADLATILMITTTAENVFLALNVWKTKILILECDAGLRQVRAKCILIVFDTWNHIANHKIHWIKHTNTYCLVAPRNKQQGEECGECEGSGGIGLMPSINIGPALGCGSCASGLECVKEDENQKLGRCQSSNFSQPSGSF